MGEYILKSALVAEMEKLKDEANIYPSDFYCGRLSICKELMNFLDTLEVKEVDLEKEVERFAKECGYKSAATIDFQFAKHFFELGIKAQKGEEV